jgi:hypothetical protein
MAQEQTRQRKYHVLDQICSVLGLRKLREVLLIESLLNSYRVGVVL